MYYSQYPTKNMYPMMSAKMATKDQLHSENSPFAPAKKISQSNSTWKIAKKTQHNSVIWLRVHLSRRCVTRYIKGRNFEHFLPVCSFEHDDKSVLSYTRQPPQHWPPCNIYFCFIDKLREIPQRLRDLFQKSQRLYWADSVVSLHQVVTVVLLPFFYRLYKICAC